MDQNVTDIGHRPDAPNGARSVPNALVPNRMGRVSFEVRQEVKDDLEKKAESLGVSLAAYSRRLVLDGSKRDAQVYHAETLRSIKAAVLTLVELGLRAQRLTPEYYNKSLREFMDFFDKARGKS
jgi:hypothetical protein